MMTLLQARQTPDTPLTQASLILRNPDITRAIFKGRRSYLEETSSLPLLLKVLIEGRSQIKDLEPLTARKLLRYTYVS